MAHSFRASEDHIRQYTVATAILKTARFLAVRHLKKMNTGVKKRAFFKIAVATVYCLLKEEELIMNEDFSDVILISEVKTQNNIGIVASGGWP